MLRRLLALLAWRRAPLRTRLICSHMMEAKHGR